MCFRKSEKHFVGSNYQSANIFDPRNELLARGHACGCGGGTGRAAGPPRPQEAVARRVRRARSLCRGLLLAREWLPLRFVRRLCSLPCYLSTHSSHMSATCTIDTRVFIRTGVLLLGFYFTGSKLTKVRAGVKQKLDANYKVGGQRSARQVLFDTLIFWYQIPRIEYQNELTIAYRCGTCIYLSVGSRMQHPGHWHRGVLRDRVRRPGRAH